MPESRPVRVAIADDYALVVAGVAAILHPHPAVEVVELDSQLPTISEVDVLLYDTFSQVQAHQVRLDDLFQGTTARVAAYSWNVQPELVTTALDRGFAGYLSKSLSAEELVDALVRIHAGETVTPVGGAEQEAEQGTSLDAARWPGREFGLSSRESEVVALITQGLSNQEIADRAYLSINSVKTYIRSAYRKIGVQRRSQAVAWGLRNGFEPDVTRMR